MRATLWDVLIAQRYFPNVFDDLIHSERPTEEKRRELRALIEEAKRYETEGISPEEVGQKERSDDDA